MNKLRVHNCENLAEFNSMECKYSYGTELLMGFLRTVKDEYIGGLRFSAEIKRNFSIPRKSSAGPRRVGKTSVSYKKYNPSKNLEKG